jgi:hypothetical protein
MENDTALKIKGQVEMIVFDGFTLGRNGQQSKSIVCQ